MGRPSTCPAIWTEVTRAKTVEEAPAGHRVPMSTHIGIHSRKCVT